MGLGGYGESVLNADNIVKDLPEAIVCAFVKDSRKISAAVGEDLIIEGIKIDPRGRAEVNCLYIDSSGIYLLTPEIDLEVYRLKEKIAELAKDERKDSLEFIETKIELASKYHFYQLYNSSLICFHEARKLILKQLR